MVPVLGSCVWGCLGITNEFKVEVRLSPGRTRLDLEASEGDHDFITVCGCQNRFKQESRVFLVMKGEGSKGDDCAEPKGEGH